MDDNFIYSSSDSVSSEDSSLQSPICLPVNEPSPSGPVISLFGMFYILLV